MRILIVNNYAHVTGGADLHCLEITEGLRARGHDVCWLSTDSSRNVERSGHFVPLTVSAENRDELPWRLRLDAARRALWNPAAASGMKSLVSNFEPDVVHVHKAYVQLSVAPVAIAARAGLPLVQTVHDYEFVSASPFDSSGGRWDRDDSRLAYRTLNSLTFVAKRSIHRPRINSWIAVSRAVASTYASKANVEIGTIPNFAEPSSSAPIRLEERSGVLFLGRLSREKGVEHLLEAARKLPDIRFRIAGDGPLKEKVTRAATELPNIDYMGFVSKSEGRRLIQKSVCCLMPSTWEEPGPLACLESMAEGTPVICYQRGGLAEYVTDAQAGIVCEGVGPDELVVAIDRLMADPELWTRSSANGRSAIAGRHSRTNYLDALESVYRSTIAAVGRPDERRVYSSDR